MYRKCHRFFLGQATGKTYFGWLEAKKYYDIPGRLDPEEATLTGAREWARVWRLARYSHRALEDSKKMTPRRNPGLGIAGRLAWTDIGWWTGGGSSLKSAHSTAKGVPVPNRPCAPCGVNFTGALLLTVGAEDVVFLDRRGKKIITERVFGS
jgi:hypothetical protein